MYDGKTQFLIKNPINRYLINSPMLPGMKNESRRVATLYIQTGRLGLPGISNWLPAPDGPDLFGHAAVIGPRRRRPRSCRRGPAPGIHRVLVVEIAAAYQ